MANHVPRYAARLTAARAQKNEPKMESIARDAHCSVGSVSNALNGRKTPSDDLGDRILIALGDKPDSEWREMLREARRPATGQSKGGTRGVVRMAAAVAALVGLLLGGAAIAIVYATADESEASSPAATTTYALYRSTNGNDGEVGAPFVIRPTGDPPRPEYELTAELGLGPALDENVEIPGTRLIYDLFCSGDGKVGPCGGVYRSHFFTAERDAGGPWPTAPSRLGPKARLYAPAPEGACRPGQVSIHRYEQPVPRQIARYSLGSAAPAGAGWLRSELLGCLIR